MKLFRHHLNSEPSKGKISVVAVVWAPHILTNVVIHGIVKSGLPFFPIHGTSVSSGLMTLRNHIDAFVLLCNISKLIPIDGFSKCHNNSTSTNDSIFSRDDWSLFLRSDMVYPQPHPFSSPFMGHNSHLIYVISTSGSFSKKQKLVFVADSCLTANVIDLSTRFSDEQDRDSEVSCVLLTSPLTFDPSIVQIYFSLLTHRTLIICPSSVLNVPETLLTLCLNSKVSWLQCTPSQISGLDRHLLQKFLSQSSFNILLGGEPFPLNDIESLKNHKSTFYNIYGTTEVSSWASLFKVSSFDEDCMNNDIHCQCSPPLCGSSPLGFPMLGTSFSLIPSTVESVWELGLFREYGGFSILHPKELTVTIQEFSCALSQLSLQNMWPTSDLVQYGECGKCLWFLGRKDRIIKRFGYQICLERLEHAIKMCKLPSIKIKNCRCQLSEGSTSRNAIIAFIEIRPYSYRFPRNPSVFPYNYRKSIKSHILKKIKLAFAPNFQPWLPTHFVFCNQSLPISSHGKLIYRPYTFYKSTISLKSKIIALWNESLGLSKTSIIDMHTTFMEAGGSSLMALHLVETIMQEFPSLINRRKKLLSLVFVYPFSRLYKFVLRSPVTSMKIKGRFSKSISNLTTCQTKFNLTVQHNYQHLYDMYTRGSSLQLPNSLRQVTFQLLWQHNLHKCIDASPLIVSGLRNFSNGCTFVGSHSGSFSALCVPNGHTVWPNATVSLPGRIEASATLAFAGSSAVLMIGSLNGSIYGLDIERGTSLCSYNTGGSVKSPASYVHYYSFLACGSHGKLVHALDLRFLIDVKPIWTNSFDSTPIVSPISVSTTTQTSVPYLIIASLGGTIGCLDPRNPSQLVWVRGGKVPVFSKPLLYMDYNYKANVIAATVSGKIQSYSTVDGHLNWSYECSGELSKHAIFSDPVLDAQSHNVILSTNKGFLFALNTTTGNLEWMLDCKFDLNSENLCSLNTPSLLQSGPFSRKGNSLLIGTRSDGLVYACSLPSRNISGLSIRPEPPTVWSTYRLPSQCFSSPVLYSENASDVYVVTGCRDNYVYGLSL
ncbi:Acyl-CoA synthetase family member 4 [Schistosoma japonicum]|uniref:Acyl-CoA synthetase family member 4 n=1 Tax=Schistosoma japonicum TaxID=6182 RepID=A0A4Z2CPA5_SCHJA|nr:Acyl-CoA synthetase family member 4 [Schistosoma japonicum]